jgi:hypothetical protein
VAIGVTALKDNKETLRHHHVTDPRRADDEDLFLRFATACHVPSLLSLGFQ